MAPDRRNEILDAAGKCFTRFGYDKTTLDDIGNMVGINKVSLYYYFKNKETLFAEMISREADEFMSKVLKNVEGISSPRERILAWIAESFKYTQSGSVLHQLSMETLKKLTPQLEGLKIYAQKKSVETIEAMLKEGQVNEFIPCNTNKVAEIIQRIMYSMKESAYNLVKSGQAATLDSGTLDSDIAYAVSLVLDGISLKK